MSTKSFCGLSLLTCFLFPVSLCAATVQSWNFNDNTAQGWSLSYMQINQGSISPTNTAYYQLNPSNGSLRIGDNALVRLTSDPGALFYTLPSVNLIDYIGGTLSFNIGANTPSGIGVQMYTSQNDFVVIGGLLGGEQTYIGASFSYAKDGGSHLIQLNLSADSFNQDYAYKSDLLGILLGGEGEASGVSLSSSEFNELLANTNGLYIGTYSAQLQLTLGGDSRSISWIDNVILAPVPEASSYTAVFSSLLFGFVFLRRRRR